MERNFRETLISRQERVNSLVCIGLDSEFMKIPLAAQRGGNECQVSIENTIVEFNCAIVEATRDIACAYKLNLAFYVAQGDDGLRALHRTIANIHFVAREVPVILDAKVADIGNTNYGYMQMAFNYLKADAVTVHPYLGAEALQPFLECTDKGIFVLCRTSNAGAGEFQDLQVPAPGNAYHVPLYQRVADNVATGWNRSGNCGLVVGATYPEELKRVRQIVGDSTPLLVPGIGAQGGDIGAAVKAGIDSQKRGMIINSSRGLIFASSGSDFADAARSKAIQLRDQINLYR